MIRALLLIAAAFCLASAVGLCVADEAAANWAARFTFFGVVVFGVYVDLALDFHTYRLRR